MAAMKIRGGMASQRFLTLLVVFLIVAAHGPTGHVHAQRLRSNRPKNVSKRQRTGENTKIPAQVKKKRKDRKGFRTPKYLDKEKGKGKGKGKGMSSEDDDECEEYGFSYPACEGKSGGKGGASSDSGKGSGAGSSSDQMTNTRLKKPYVVDKLPELEEVSSSTPGGNTRNLLRERKQQLSFALPALYWHPVLQDLQQVGTRYYMYDDCDILQCDLLRELTEQGTPKSDRPDPLDHLSIDLTAEANIIEALANHPLRTADPNEASLYIIPLPIALLISYGCRWEDCVWFEQSFEALFNHPIFQQNHGNNHVLISQAWVAFNPRFYSQLPAISTTLYRKLANVTVATHYDPSGPVELLKNPERLHGSGYAHLFQWEAETVTRGFSTGLIGKTDLPFNAASMQRFHSSRNFMFYHCRAGLFAFGSTKIRHALLLDSADISRLPTSSIGFDISGEEWIDNILSSKFCLSIRGDTPHSHSALHSLRAGCIPVIVSDFYEEYAPSLKSVLSMKDWAIFIDEADFLADPVGALEGLDGLPPVFIEEKIANMTLAQNIILGGGSPYFVPAFLRQALQASSTAAPFIAHHAEQRSSTMKIGGVQRNYMYPKSFVGSIDLFQEAPLLVGVISVPENYRRRSLIRETWAKNHPHVYFVVYGGAWEDVSEEFHMYGDMLWIDAGREKTEKGITIIIQESTFLQATVDHVGSYGYVIQTTDDMYVQLDKLELLVHSLRPEFWGGCDYVRRNDFNDNLGFVVSRGFAQCAVKKIQEEQQDGMDEEDQDNASLRLDGLGGHCGLTCSDEGWDYSDRRGESIIQKFEDGRDLYYLHELVTWGDHTSPYWEGVSSLGTEY